MYEQAAAKFSGLWVPVVTPFGADGTVDLASLKRLAERLLGDGVDGLVALGTTGEPSTMTADERRQVVEVCASVCSQAGRPLLVGAGTNSTAATVEEVRLVTDGLTVAGVLIVVPYYTRPSEQAVVEHFSLVADQSPVPVVLYNIPYRTGRGLGAAALIEASRHRNIVGLKQAVGGIDTDTLEVLARGGEGFDVLAGDDAFIAPTLLMGAAGAIAAAAHLCTPQFVEMVAAARAGDVTRSVQLATKLLPVVTAGFVEPSPSVWKGALAAQSEIANAYVRRPLTTASQSSVSRLLTTVG